MPLTEIILTTITEKVFSYALEQGQSIAGDWVRKKLKLDPKQQAFKRALDKAYQKFEKKYPQWANDLFNTSFLENEGAPILAQFLIRDGNPDPSELATRWADSLNIRNPERRTTLVRELEPAASDFLDYLASELKKEPELSDLNDSRTFEQFASDLTAIRYKLGAEQATHGTRRDYLHWLIERNLYLDPRGTFQTQRQVQVKLDEVYISLRAQREIAPSEVDRRLLEQEMAKLEEKIMRGNLPAEEIEDQQEHVMARLESRFLDTKNAPGEIVELAEAVKRHERLVILGDPGSGKSTLLRYLALIHAQALYAGRSEAGSEPGTARFPILIRIADYAEHGMPHGKSLSQYLADYYEMHECPKLGLSDLLAKELIDCKCLVLLDGLDEIVNADDRRKVVERIEDFIRFHDNRPNRFVITSRIAGYRSAPLGDPFVQYTVQEMDDTQIHRFLERWCTAVEAAQTPELSQEARNVVARREIDGIMKAVQSSPGVHRLAANPLLLRTLALIHRTGAQLPQKRIELYKLAADTLARTWRMAQGVSETALVDDKYLTRLLGRLAYWLHENKSTGIATEQEVYRELGQEWARIKGFDWDEDNPDIENEVKKFLQAVREHTGLFVERAPKRYGFMHLTFEEYYAARHLVARSKDRARLIRAHLHKPRWEEPILLALGFVGLDSPEDAADLLETAILAEGEEARELGFTPSQYEELLGRDFLFALRCLGDNIPVRPKVLKKLMKRLADELLYQKGSAKLSRYRQALNEKLEYLNGSEGAIALNPYLIDALHDTDANVRSVAAESLGRLAQASPEALSALIDALHDTDATVRYVAAQSLGRLAQPSPEVIKVLLEGLHQDNYRSVRRDSARLLGQIGQSDEQTIQALWHGLLDEENNVRTACTQALAQLGRRFPNAVKVIERKLIEAIEDQEFEKPDSLFGRSGHDYAYDGLWWLVVGGELQGD
jgi:energy-coupling factor transporter ATP-binding protein EcfA2